LTKDLDATLSTFSASLICSTTPKTLLRDYLLDRDYERLLSRLKTHPEEATRKIDLTVSPSDANSVNSSGEDPIIEGTPLHLACAMRPLPPVSVLKALLRAHPEAANQVESKWGMLPLHFAVNLSYQNHDTSRDDDDDDASQVRVVRLLLFANPKALGVKETFQGRTPLQLAAATTLQSVGGKIPPVSASVLEILLYHAPCMDSLGGTDKNGETAFDIAQQASKEVSRTVCFAGGDWQANPLLRLLDSTDFFAAKQHQSGCKDNQSETDATSVTMSISSASMTALDDGGSSQEHSTRSIEDLEQSGQDESEPNFDDDASFTTARSSMEYEAPPMKHHMPVHACVRPSVPAKKITMQSQSV